MSSSSPEEDFKYGWTLNFDCLRKGKCSYHIRNLTELESALRRKGWTTFSKWPHQGRMYYCLGRHHPATEYFVFGSARDAMVYGLGPCVKCPIDRQPIPVLSWDRRRRVRDNRTKA